MSSVKIAEHIDIDELIEMFERRNLIVHANSVVNDNYVRNCASLSKRDSILQKGDQAKVNRSYLKQVIDMLSVFAVISAHLIWLKQDKKYAMPAEGMLMEVTYDLIHQGRYNAAIQLFEYCERVLKSRFSGDERRLMLLINHANALALYGRQPEAIAKLDSEDWSAKADKFVICVESIKQNLDTVCSMLTRLGDAGPISEAEFRDWPVFEHVRDKPEFAKCFESVFGRSLNQTSVMEINSANEGETKVATAI